MSFLYIHDLVHMLHVSIWGTQGERPPPRRQWLTALCRGTATPNSLTKYCSITAIVNAQDWPGSQAWQVVSILIAQSVCQELSEPNALLELA